MFHDGDTFEHNGRSFRVNFPKDEFGRVPWEDCGHGPVSDWTTRDKRPGERVLATDGHYKRFYDVQEATATAKRDGWDAEPLGEGTPGQRAARAVDADFDRLRRWCNDVWEYVGCVVTLLDDDGEDTDQTTALWGIESDCYDYLAETAHELAGQLVPVEQLKLALV